MCRNNLLFKIIQNTKEFLYFLVFLIPPVLVLAAEYLQNDVIGTISSDGQLYLSIADNVLSTGHFIQNARSLPGFVVPPGLPLALTIIRAISHNNIIIIIVQSILLGLSCLLLFDTAYRLVGTLGFIAPLIYCGVYLLGGIYLGNILVEHWYLFLLCLMVWMLEKNRGGWSIGSVAIFYFTSLACLLTRPALLPIFLVSFIWMVIFLIREKKFVWLLTAISFTFFFFCLNIWINYRETGEIILLESYSGADIYAASVSDAAVSKRQAQLQGLSDPIWEKLYYDESISMNEKSRQFRELTESIIREDPIAFFSRTILRGIDLYFVNYYGVLVAALFGGIILYLKEKRKEDLIGLTINFLLAVISCFGIWMRRYTLPVWPLASIHITVLIVWLYSKVRSMRSRARG